jgi:NADH:ubiquinone oxidoreductase subunit E
MIFREERLMKKKISKLPFKGTAEQEAQLKKVIDEFKDDKSNLMVVMQKAQDIYGYLPFEVQEMISEGMGVSLEKIYGVATFYAQFSLAPKGEYNISVCLGTACYVKGAQNVIDKFQELLGVKPGETTEDGLFTLDALRCIGACGIAPAVSINGRVYPKVKVDQVPEIIKELKEEAATA